MFKFIKNLFGGWERLYSTPNAEKHFPALEKLSNNGIKYKTKVISFGGGYGGGEGFNSVYDIYVPKSSLHESNRIIHHA